MTVDSLLWYTIRGAGAVSLVLLTAILCLGIVSALRWSSPAWPRFLTVGLHRNLALLALVVLALHIVLAVVDPYTALGWRAAVIPFAVGYRRLWLGLGSVALYLIVTLVVTSLLRQVIGLRLWRFVHWAAYACWPVAMIHGMGTGSDFGLTWMVALDVVSAAAVVAAVGLRLRAGSVSISSPESAAALRPAVRAERPQ
ncbi:MAG TPA: ferric reductase-like transmembrane domain-containing protein [Candidatus Dormibacteraeota bacterium]|jgi:predicted ferric reductase|nr:ferric reductase-like transmembrane domain-containing protein [Candidatus Dormibacteraeota bacterium]